MYRLLNYFLIIIYGLWNRITVKKTKEKSNKLLVIMDQMGIGDAVCSLDAFYNISLYTRNQYELYIATTPSVIRFLKECHSTFDAHLIPLELGKSNKFTFKIFKRNYKSINQTHWRYILAFNRIGNYMKLLLMGCSYDNLLGMEYHEWKISLLEKFFRKWLRNYTCIILNYLTQIMQIYSLMTIYALNELIESKKSIEYIKYKIPSIGKNPLEKLKKRYCIISPAIALQEDHPNPYRRWPLERFINITNFILEHSSLNICLCGVVQDQKDNEYLRSHCKNSSRIIDMTGKTSFKEWIEIIRDAKFVFGNDSGYIHLASHLGVPSFVLAGYWNYGKFLPYEGNFVADRTKPIDIRIPMVPCMDCNRKKVNNSTKQQCNSLVREHHVYKCIWDIDVDLVKKIMISSGVLK